MMVIFVKLLKMGTLKEIINEIESYEIGESFNCLPEECLKYVKHPSSHLKVLQQNIRSLNKNYASLLTLLSRFGFACDIIVLSECWLSCVSNLPTMNGYSNYRTTVNFNQNDGVVVFVNNELNCSVEEAHISEANCLLIKIGLETVIIAVYRPCCFTNVDAFLNSLSCLLDQLKSFKNIVMVGDININIADLNQNTANYLDILTYAGMVPSYFTATRGNSCLDHTVLKTRLPTLTFLLQSSVSDHEAILLCTKIKNITDLKRNITFNTKVNMKTLIRDSAFMNFTAVYEAKNVDCATNIFINYTQKLILSNSIKYRLPRNKITIKPWITSGLLRCIRNRDKMHMKLKKEPDNDILKITYRRYRNFCNDIIKKCKRHYENEELREAGSNTKKLWHSIKNITNLNKRLEPPLQLLSTATSQQESIDYINKFFVGVGANLANKIPPNIPDFPETLLFGRAVVDSFFLSETNCDEVEYIIMNLKSCNSAGWDGISTKVLKAIKKVIAHPLVYIFNRCLSEGVFPSALKRSVVIPIFKSGERTCINNYRPISILPVVSKVLERIINVRLKKFLETRQILSPCQYGFRSGRSTDDAVHSLVNHVVNKLDNNIKCLTIFLDLAKAFDTVSLPKLLFKLENMGIRGTQLSLFKDYLSNRTQRVRIGGMESSDDCIEFGVPQGSVLGPTLFLCYMNDLCELKINNCNIIAYADDTTLTFHGDTWESVYLAAQQGFDHVCHWLANNSLTLNSEKTKLMKFSIRNYKLPLTLQPNVIAHSCFSQEENRSCSCPIIQETQHIKYLGVTIDHNLNFYEHIKALTKKVRKLSFVFKQLRHVADSNVMKMVYVSLCQSLLMYCITTWGGAAKTFMLEAERAQRMILKICNFKPRLHPTSALYEECGVLTVRQLFILASVVKQHQLVEYPLHLGIVNSRREYMVCEHFMGRTSFINKFFIYQGGRLYNKINRFCHIHSKTKRECKKVVSCWLQKLNYENTEDLLVSFAV